MPSVVCVGYFALLLAVVVGGIFGLGILGTGWTTAKKGSRGKRLVTSLPLSILIGLAVCCASAWLLSDVFMSSFYPTSPNRKPSEQDVIGLWQLTDDSLEMLREYGYKVSSHTVEFKPDGTFVLTNLPDMVWNFGEANGKFESGSGIWKIDKDINRDWVIDVRFNELNGNAKDFGASFSLYGKEPPYRIYDYIGDPDSGRILTFEK